MDINNNTQQTNTFLKGMNTDISDALIGDSEYRLAENLRYVTNTESNTGELRLIEGDVPCTLNLNVEDKEDRRFTVLAATSIRDLIILVVNESVRETYGEHYVWIYDGWSVLKGTLEDTTLDLQRVFGPCKERLSDNKLSLVTRWEDEDNIKLYIADGEHPLMVVNVGSKESVGTTIEQISNVRNVILTPLSVGDYIEGSLKPALVQYSYRLYNTNGVSTNMSPVTQLYKIHDYKNGYVYGYKQGVKTSKGFRLSGTINQNFEKIQLYRITYEMNGQEPTIELIYQGKYDNNFTYDDRGAQALSSMSLAEYNSIAGINIIPSVIESKNDYLFAGNIKYIQHKYDEEIINWDARAYVTGDYYVQNGNTIYCINNPSSVPTDAEITNDNLVNISQEYDFTKWLDSTSNNNYSIGGTGVNIKYKFVIRSEGLDTTCNTNASIFRNSDNRDRHVSLWRDEVYRYGIVLYDKNGLQYPVKWIMDVRTPAQKDTYTKGTTSPLNNSIGDIITYNNNQLNSNVLGIQFQINNLPSSVTSYDIVRCNRGAEDRRIICQGLLSTTAEHDGLLCSTGAITSRHIHYIDHSDEDHDVCSESNINVLQFFSPDVSYQQDDVADILDQNDNHVKILKGLRAITNYEVDNRYNILHINNDPDAYVYKLNKLSHSEQGQPSYNSITCEPGLSYQDSDWDRFNNRRTSGDTYITYCKPYLEEFYSKNVQHVKVETNDQNQEVVTIEDKVASFNYDVNTFAKVADVPNWNSFSTNTPNPQLTFRDDVVSIGGYTFYKWSVPYFLTEDYTHDADIISYLTNSDYINGFNVVPKYEVPFGTTDTSLLLQLNTVNDSTTNTDIVSHLYDDLSIDEPDNYRVALMCNLYKDTTPYGGYTNYARTNSIYYSYGNRHLRSENEINVFDGDCFIKLFECTPLHTWYNAKLKYIWKSCITYAIPVETSIDLDTTYGTTYTRALGDTKDEFKAACVQNQPANVFDKFTQTTPMYVYNTAYNANSRTDSYTGMEQEDIENNNYDCRVYYSQVKTNNEPIDNWTIFKAANYIDVDTRYGQITDLRLFNDQLIYWQTDATGVLSVNERTLLQDVNNTNIMLGTGDVLQRYDYLTTEYGMKPNQYAEVKSNTTLYWWDGYKKEILGYGGRNSGVVPMSKTKNVQNYINSREEIDTCPTLAYDFKYNEVMFNVVDGGSLTYNEMVQAFVSVYPHTYFLNKVQLRDGLLLTDEEHVRKWNTNDEGAESFGEPLLPMLKYVVNKASTEVKVFDNVRFGGRFYGGDFQDDENIDDLEKLTFKFNTPLKQHSELKGKDITNREYDFRFAVPRNGGSDRGDRMRGKIMQCELSSDSNSLDFSLQYITTKFRISWS